MGHVDYPHEDRTLYDCPECERPCDTDCPGRDMWCVGSHMPKCGMRHEPHTCDVCEPSPPERPLGAV